MAVPLLAVAPRLGAAGLAAAIVLILLERTGKAIRSPGEIRPPRRRRREPRSRPRVRGAQGAGSDRRLRRALAGRRRHRRCRDVVAGFRRTRCPRPDPAGLPAPRGARPRRTGPTRNHPGTAAAPGSSTTPALPPTSAATHSDPPPRPGRGWIAAATGGNLPRAFVTYAVATSLTTGGLVTFGVLGYHLTTLHVIATSALHRTGHCGRADPSPRARCACDLAGRPSRLRISAPGDQSPWRDHALASGGVAAG